MALCPLTGLMPRSSPRASGAKSKTSATRSEYWVVVCLYQFGFNSTVSSVRVWVANACAEVDSISALCAQHVTLQLPFTHMRVVGVLGRGKEAQLDRQSHACA